MRSRLLALLWLLLPLPLLVAQARPPAINSPEHLVQQGANLNQSAAQNLESQLEKNPEDLNTRARLLGYYYYQWMQPGEAAAKAARRRHILWLIEHHPDSPILSLGEAPIDETGNSLADPDGYQKARQLWLAQMEARKGDAPMLGNLAKFFQMTDKDLAESALLQAKAAQPLNPEWDWRLGYLYAMGILGVDALGLNGQPTSVDPIAATGPFAVKSHKLLAESTSGTMLAVAASILWRYGTMLASSDKVRLDWLDEAAKLVEQAKKVDPTNPSWAQFLLQIQNYKRQILSPALRPAK